MKARYGQSLSPWKFDRKLKHKAVHYNDNDNSSPEMYDWKRVIILILASFKADDDVDDGDDADAESFTRI